MPRHRQTILQISAPAITAQTIEPIASGEKPLDTRAATIDNKLKALRVLLRKGSRTGGKISRANNLQLPAVLGKPPRLVHSTWSSGEIKDRKGPGRRRR
jgi:hypothetical protein